MTAYAQYRSFNAARGVIGIRNKLQLAVNYISRHCRLLFIFVCALFNSSCATGIYYFNGNEPFFRMQTAYENDVVYCRDNSSYSSLPRSTITTSRNYDYTLNGSSTTFIGDSNYSKNFIGRGTINNNNEVFANNTAILAAEIYNSINRNSSCMSNLGWVNVKTRNYTPKEGNEKIAYNREFLKLSRDGYSDMIVAAGQTYMINKENSRKISSEEYFIRISAITNNPYNPYVDICNFNIYKDRYKSECSSGISEGEIRKGSVISIYISLLENNRRLK